MNSGDVFINGDDTYFQLGELPGDPQAPFVPLYFEKCEEEIFLSCDEINNRYFIHPQTGVNRYPHFGMMANLKFARLMNISTMQPFLIAEKIPETVMKAIKNCAKIKAKRNIQPYL